MRGKTLHFVTVQVLSQDKISLFLFQLSFSQMISKFAVGQDVRYNIEFALCFMWSLQVRLGHIIYGHIR